MRSVVTILLLTSLLSLEVNAAPRRRAASAPIDPDAITISFTPMEGIRQMTWTTLDVGTLARHERARGARVVRTVAIGIDRKNGVAGGTAELRAFVQSADPRHIVRVDGIVLSGAPTLIDAHAPIGASIPHRIEIEVPPAVPEGAVASNIEWQVTTN
jgi:hypothetical protein